MPNWISSLIFVCIIFIGCSGETDSAENDNTESQVEVEESPQLPEGFESFYKKFHTDSAFQMERIQFPLQGVPEDRSLATDTFTFQKSNWKIHQPFITNNSVFERRFRNVGERIVIEYIFSPRLQVIMERRFQKRSDGWYLIYYKELGDRTQTDIVQ